MTKRPNIVLITSDQLRPYELGCYGGTQVATPNIDRLAARGTMWETAITNFPVCMAARSVLISGQMNRTATGGKTNVAYAGRQGDFNMPEYPYPARPHLKDPTIAEVLQGAGYETSVIGKWHIHSWPHEIGFDHYLIPRVHHAHSAQIYSRDGGPEFAPEGYSVEFEASEAEQFFDARRDADQPFFLYYNISPPHCPVADMPDEYLSMYAPEDMDLRENTDEARIENKDYWYKVYRWDFRYYSFRLPHTMEVPPGYDLRHLAAEYAGAVTWMDRAVGRVLDGLAAAGLQDDTLVIFASDHGENLGSHGFVQKGTENDESIRVPLIMAGPGVTSGGRVGDAVASLLDLAPTLADAAGVPRPAHFQGTSLWGDLRGENTGRAAFFETVRGAGIRTPDSTYFLPFEGDRALSTAPSVVFNNSADPYQYTNLAGKTAMPEQDAMLRRLDAETPWTELEDDPQ